MVMSEQRLIDADALVNKLIAIARKFKMEKKSSLGVRYHQFGAVQCTAQNIIEHINNGTFPIIEAEPVRYGRWVDPEDDNGGTEWHCSECGFTVKTLISRPRYRFCPNCGARMDEDVT